MQILPHVQDTSEFFVTVLHKLHNLPRQNKPHSLVRLYMSIDVTEEPQAEKGDIK